MQRECSSEQPRQHPVSVLSVVSASCLTPEPSNPYNPLLVYNQHPLPLHSHPVGHLVTRLVYGKSLYIFAKCPAKISAEVPNISASFLVSVSRP
jgi:hypothetical protein